MRGEPVLQNSGRYEKNFSTFFYLAAKITDNEVRIFTIIKRSRI